MATVCHLLPSLTNFYETLHNRIKCATNERWRRYIAVLKLEKFGRGYVIRKHVKRLNISAIIIQSLYRRRLALKCYRNRLVQSAAEVHNMHYKHMATILQALWRGYHSRRTKFCYRAYRHWLATIKERGERRVAEAVEFGVRNRADDLKILEEESRQWLAFVVFKLHHLLRTYSCAGVYSEPATTELSDFEKLLKSIHYTEYMHRLKRKYDAFVRKHRPAFSNKKLFPIIGDGADYWYLSLPEMYELTRSPKIKDDRHKATHHGHIHKEPFLWKKVRPPKLEAARGPFNSPKKITSSIPPPPSPTPANSIKLRTTEDPRFQLYVKHYTPQPALFDYVNFHINVLLKIKEHPDF